MGSKNQFLFHCLCIDAFSPVVHYLSLIYFFILIFVFFFYNSYILSFKFMVFWHICYVSFHMFIHPFSLLAESYQCSFILQPIAIFLIDVYLFALFMFYLLYHVIVYKVLHYVSQIFLVMFLKCFVIFYTILICLNLQNKK